MAVRRAKQDDSSWIRHDGEPAREVARAARVHRVGLRGRLACRHCGFRADAPCPHFAVAGVECPHGTDWEMVEEVAVSGGRAVREETAGASAEQTARAWSNSVGRWLVLRHSGRSGDPWRLKFWTGVEAEARARFDELAGELRQGGVALATPEGEIINITSAPRLRTRW